MWKFLRIFCMIFLLGEAPGINAMHLNRRHDHPQQSYRDLFNDRPQASLHRTIFSLAPTQLNARSNHASKRSRNYATYGDPTNVLPYPGGPRRANDARNVIKRQYAGYRPRRVLLKCGETYKEVEIGYSDTMKEVTMVKSVCNQEVYGR